MTAVSAHWQSAVPPSVAAIQASERARPAKSTSPAPTTQSIARPLSTGSASVPTTTQTVSSAVAATPPRRAEKSASMRRTVPPERARSLSLIAPPPRR